jgi:NADPH2:quinone reductase
MRALVRASWGGPALPRVEELPDPVAKPAQVLRCVKAAGVNFPDVLIMQKKYQVQPP